MNTALSTFDFHQPRDLGEALRMMRDHGPLSPLAGCTDVYVDFHFGRAPSSKYIDLSCIEELRGIDVIGDVMRIGAMTTYSEIIASDAVATRLPILAAAAREIGGVQIQNRGTLGGNIANASPAGDTLPVLAVAEATVILQSADGERKVPFGQFYTGYRRSVCAPHELITAVEIAPVQGMQWFRKVGTRAAQAISKVVVAGVRASHPRVAVGSVAPTVIRLTETERCLADGGSIDDACTVLEGEVHPIDDVRSTAAYRKRVLSNLVRRFWLDTQPQ